MIQLIKRTLHWFGFLIFIALFLGSLKTGITWVFFLGLSALVFPPFGSYLTKINKKPKLGIGIGLGIAFFLAAMFLSPKDSNVDPQKITENPGTSLSVEKTTDPTKFDRANQTSITTTSPDKVTQSELESATKTFDDAPSTSSSTSDSSQTSIKSSGSKSQQEVSATSKQKEPDQSSNFVKVHFIDVGQGDATLIEADGQFCLIDAGEEKQASDVIDYLRDQKVKKLDYVIGSHPHSDHIGGLDLVINAFSIGKVILPDVDHNTREFDELLDAIESNQLKITKSEVGKEYTLGSASFTIIAPNGTDYKDLNDYSVGIKLTHKKSSFLLIGDAEEVSEKEIADNGLDISADVLKLGHHGSKYSGYKGFLDEVDPSYAVISAGMNNSYGHPHRETLQDMKNRKVQVFRTDKQGTIVLTSDGESITTNTKAYTITSSDLSDTKPTENPLPDTVKKPTPKPSTSTQIGDTIVHITNTGSKYHRADCRYLNKSDIKTTLGKAVKSGLEPCITCKPPTK